MRKSLISAEDFFFSGVPKLTFLILGVFFGFFLLVDSESPEKNKATCFRLIGSVFLALFAKYWSESQNSETVGFGLGLGLFNVLHVCFVAAAFGGGLLLDCCDGGAERGRLVMCSCLFHSGLKSGLDAAGVQLVVLLS